MSVCLSVTFVDPMSLIISTFVCLSFVFVCQYIIGTAKCPSVFLPSVCISVYTCPFTCLSVRPSHVGIMSTPLNISTIFYRETRMHSTNYVVARCSSVCEANSIQTFICLVQLMLHCRLLLTSCLRILTKSRQQLYKTTSRSLSVIAELLV